MADKRFFSLQALHNTIEVALKSVCTTWPAFFAFVQKRHFCVLTFEEKMGAGHDFTGSKPPCKCLCFWFCGILISLFIYFLYITHSYNAVLVVPHIPVGIATLCMDHLEKVPKFWSLYYVYVWKYFSYVLTIYVAAQSCYIFLSIIIIIWIL